MDKHNKCRAKDVIKTAYCLGITDIYGMEAFSEPPSWVETSVTHPEIWIGFDILEKQRIDVLCGRASEVVFLVMDYHSIGNPEKTRFVVGTHVDTIEDGFVKCFKALDCYWKYR